MKQTFTNRAVTALCLIFVFLSGISFAEEGIAKKSVKAIGTSPIYNNNNAKAREEAIADALAAAVNIRGTELLSSQDFSHNFQKISEIVHGRTKDFIENYKVLAESCTGKTCQVLIEAGISAEALQQALSAFGKIETKPETPSDTVTIHAKKSDKQPDVLPDDTWREIKPQTPPDKQSEIKPDETLPDIKHEPKLQTQPESKTPKALPKTLLLIAEQNLENAYPRYWWRGNPQISTLSEKAMSRKIAEKGFTVSDHPDGIPDSTLRISVMYQADIDNSDALKIGRLLNTEVVITGKSMVYVVQGNSADRSFSATVTARAIRTDTGEQLASTLQTALTVNRDDIVGSNDALEKASNMATEDLVSQISALWQNNSAKPETRPVLVEWIELSVSGTAKVGNFIRFRKVLSEIPAVRELRVVESKGNEAKLNVNFDGNIRSLADVLKQTDFQLFRVNIREVSQNQIILELIP